jgi:hypothetical protein
MEWNVLKTAADYKKAVIRSMDIFNPIPDSPEDKELDLLLVLIKDYEDRHINLLKGAAIATGTKPKQSVKAKRKLVH